MSNRTNEMLIQRVRNIVFAATLLALSWLAMMAVHELGHVLGAKLTGGKIVRVVLHPLTISQTDVMPNPHPAFVVWLGPIVGCVLPVIAWLLISERLVAAKSIAVFFAGFCLIANGCYIAVGSFDGVGDCGEMLETGSPFWTLLAFGAVTISTGLFLWHQLGSIRQFFSEPSVISTQATYMLLFVLAAVVATEFVYSPR